jgi:phosphatidylserine/phosphatidylglycerophosphate/cardiolipin synthase-like enzyme
LPANFVPVRLSAVISAAIILLSSCTAFIDHYERDQEDQQASTTDSLELIFNRPSNSLAVSSSCVNDLCESLLSVINSAEESIDFAVYGMRNQQEILEALLAAKDRGVIIRGVVDRDSEGRNYYSSTDAWAEALGEIRDDSKPASTPSSSDERKYSDNCPRPAGKEGPLQCLAYDFGDSWILAEHASTDNFISDDDGGASNLLMHNKFFIVDNEIVWTGSANISDTGTGGYNANIVALAHSPELAQIYEQEFNQMWSGKYHSEKATSERTAVRLGTDTITAYFSPQDDAMLTVVVQALSQAKETINASVFYLTDKRVTSELIAAHRRGVDIRIIIDGTAAQNGYSKHEVLRLAGIPVKVETWGGKMHMKSVSIDHERVILGSMNWTGAGSNTNDENTLLIDSARLALDHDAFFEQLWKSIDEEWQEYGRNPLPESTDSPDACKDGIDNDFDGLADDEDPSCNGVGEDFAPGAQRIVAKGETVVLPEGYKLQPSVSSPNANGNSGCDPNYSGICLPIIDSDIDCPSINAKDFLVVGKDTHRLDIGDDDPIACESKRG